MEEYDYPPPLEFEPFREDGEHIRVETGRPTAGDDVSDLEQAWFEVAAAALCVGAAAHRATSLLSQLRTSTVIYDAIGKRSDVLRKALSHISAVLGDMQFGNVWMSSLGLLDRKRIASDVADCLQQIAATAPAEHPESRLAGAVSAARKQLARQRSSELIGLIDAGASPDDLALAHTQVAQSPPTALDESMTHTDNASVDVLFAADRSTSTGLTLSSGFPSLDITLSTRAGFPRGYVASGQLVVFVAPSGSGKTSAFNTIVPAGVTDALRQGSLGRTIYVHNEDDTANIFDSMGLGPGKRYASLAKSVAFLKTTSREDFIKFFYREVLRAKRMSVETGLPVKMFAPPAVYVDYFQALSSPNDKGSEVTSTSTTADLLLYGIANCDPVACKTFSGIGFQEYTGEAWPSELTGSGIAVIVTAQLLLKGSASLSPYNPAKKDANWRDYAAADALDNPAWQPQAGDFPLAKLDDIRGSTKIIQHATTIIGLHRPRPRNNPEVGVDVRGFPTLADTRGFFTVLKARYGQRILVVPMEFNLQRNGGGKAQFIDAAAEAAIDTGVKFSYDAEMYTQSGDPIIPLRPRRSKMTAVKY